MKEVRCAQKMAASSARDQPSQLVPPDNFAMVWRGVYRSGYPTKRNFAFLRQLGLRSVLFLWLRRCAPCSVLPAVRAGRF